MVDVVKAAGDKTSSAAREQPLSQCFRSFTTKMMRKWESLMKQRAFVQQRAV